MSVRLVKQSFMDSYEKSLLDFAEEFSKKLGIRLNINEIPPIVLSLDTPKDEIDILCIPNNNGDRLGDNHHQGDNRHREKSDTEFPILGRFIYHKPKCQGESTLIEIYVRNFDKNLSMDEFNEYLRYVIAHEFFHYIHYLYDETTLSDTSKEARIICEASAEYFAYSYLQSTMNEFTSDVLNRRDKFWKETKSIYSNVLCFLGSSDPNKNDLYKVLEASKKDIKDGFNRLLELEPTVTVLA